MSARPAATTSAPTARAGRARAVARLVPAVAWMALIFAFSHRPDLPDVGTLPDALTAVLGHLVAYAVLAGLVWWAVPGLAGRRRLVVAFAVAVLYGVTDEWHQSFVPGRTPDVLDLVTDAAGAAAGLALAVRLAAARAARATRRR